MRVLVCGARDFADTDLVYRTLDALRDEGIVDLVIEGGAAGADRIAAMWAEQRGIPVEQYEADWKAQGRAVGPIRNQRMVDEGKPDLIIAFHGGAGTLDMLERGADAGIERRWIVAEKKY